MNLFWLVLLVYLLCRGSVNDFFRAQANDAERQRREERSWAEFCHRLFCKFSGCAETITSRFSLLFPFGSELFFSNIACTSFFSIIFLCPFWRTYLCACPTIWLKTSWILEYLFTILGLVQWDWANSFGNIYRIMFWSNVRCIFLVLFCLDIWSMWPFFFVFLIVSILRMLCALVSALALGCEPGNLKVIM